MRFGIAVVAVLTALILWQCGPAAICTVQGGKPVGNALGAEWCELDGNNLPSEGDYSLRW